MSCGSLHEPGHGFHVHAPGEEHEPGSEHEPVALEETGEQAAPAPEKKPGRIKVAAAGAWAQHGYMIRPFAWVPAVDGAAWTVHQAAATRFLGYGTLDAVLTAAGAGLAAEVATEIRNHRAGRGHKWKTITRRQVTLATSWAVLAAGWTPAGWQDIVQWLALVGGGALAGNYVHEARKAGRATRKARPEPEEPLAIATPRQVDERQTRLTDRFCQPGQPLDGVIAENFRELPHGFMFELVFPADTRHQMSDVIVQKVLIAKIYDVTQAKITIGYVPGAESEARCQVVVMDIPVVTAAERADPSYNRWDGRSTWKPATGLIDLGRYVDDTITHYRLNTPFSGASAGMVAGVMGAGKSGTLHVIAAEAGLAMLCSRCGARGDCGQCDPQRVMAVFAGDPQEQGLAVWRGRADLTGWGPEGCVELAEFTEAVGKARSQVLGNLEWSDTGPDGLRRRNVGKGWFDPEVGFPLILLLLDELPKLVNHPDKDMARAVLRIIVDGYFGWRKVGIHPVFGSQILDVSAIGDRALRDLVKYLNSVAHHCEEVSTNMGGIEGDPRDLPREQPGVGYIAGPDDRPGVRFTTKIMPETLRPGMTGMDIRHLAGIIERTPIAYDPGTLAVMEAWGVRHQQVFTEWKGRAPSGANDAPAPAAASGGSAATAARGPGAGGMAYREEADQVLAALRESPGADIPALMEATELSLGVVARSLDALTANGQIVSSGADQYTAA